ncbi:MAG: aldehyde dehydrogenase family protein [Pseudomonadota bacterium]
MSTSATGAFSVQTETETFLAKPDRQLLIDNQWRAAAGDKFPSLNPANNEPLAQIPEAVQADVDAAVGAARSALKSPGWRGLTGADRANLLWRLADLMEASIDSLAELETLDQGKPLGVGRWAEIPGAIAQFRFFAGQCTRLEGQTIPTSINYQPEGKRMLAYTRKQPVGVVAAIIPWNSPLIMAAMKLAPALAAGCTVVLKPAEDTSLTALRLGELILEAGFPPGVVNIVTGRGEVTGVALAEHPDVDKVAFTGSTEVGRHILAASASNMKRVTLELGGKSPVIILPDADLEPAIAGAANAIFFNGGQVCVAGSRLYAHRSVYEQVVDGVTQAARAMTLGPGLDPQTQCGPLVSDHHANRVMGYVEAGRADGAQIRCGGARAEQPGAFVEPTVMTDVSPEMSVCRDEIFGPVLVCSPFDEIDEVVTWANDSQYGLAASVWTENLSTAHQLEEDLEAGTVWINCHSMFDAALPIGGLKQSGWGRESGQQAVDNYLELKTVCAVV